jgi:hypothetical protein
MEARFDADFSQVRVHTNTQAAESAQAVGALAYTVGSDIVFGAEAYRPGTLQGRQRIAHELAHVIQQERGGKPPQLNPGAAHEHDAAAVSTAVVSGTGPVRVSGATGMGIARQASTKEIYPRLHEEILKGLIAIVKKYLKDGEDRIPALQALAKSVPAKDKPLLYERLVKPGSKDAFTVYLKNSFPLTRDVFLQAINPDVPADRAAEPTTVAPKPNMPPAHVEADLVSERFADVKSDSLYIDNFANDINQAWLPNDRVFVFTYPNGSVLRIAYQDLVQALDVKSELNPKLTEEEARTRYKIPEDLILPVLPNTDGEPHVASITIEKITFYRDKETGVIYPVGKNIYKSYLPRIANAIQQIEPTRANEELMTEFQPKILNVITSMEWSAPVGFGALLVQIGRRLRGSGGASLIRSGLSPHPPSVARQGREATKAGRQSTEAGDPGVGRATREAIKEAGEPTTTGRVALIHNWLLGPKSLPNQPSLDQLLDEAWKLLRGKKRPPISIAPSLPDNLNAAFLRWKDDLTQTLQAEIFVSARAVRRGRLVATVHHEAWHARFNELFPTLAQHKTWATLFASVDETIAYAIGGSARVRRGVGLVDKLAGLVEAVSSPWAAYGSMNNWKEAMPLIIRDIVLLTMYIRWLASLGEEPRHAPQATKRATAPSTP